MVVIFGIAMLAGVCEHQPVSKRVAATIPKVMPLRIPAFMLFSGPAGGVAYSAAVLTVTLLLYPLFFKVFAMVGNSAFSKNNETYLIAIGLALYFACYALTSLNVKTLLFRKSVSIRSTIIGVIAFLIIGSILPIIIGFLVRQNPWQELPPLWYIGNPLVLFLEKKIWVECFTFTSVWLTVTFALSIPWFFRQFKNFKTV